MKRPGQQARGRLLARRRPQARGPSPKNRFRLSIRGFAPSVPCYCSDSSSATSIATSRASEIFAAAAAVLGAVPPAPGHFLWPLAILHFSGYALVGDRVICMRVETGRAQSPAGVEHHRSGCATPLIKGERFLRRAGLSRSPLSHYRLCPASGPRPGKPRSVLRARRRG